MILFEMTVSDDMRTVDIIYKDVAYHLFYDQYMGEYFGRKDGESGRFCIGRYEYRNAPDGFNPLPDVQDFKNGFITDRLHDAAIDLKDRLGIASPKFGSIYNAEFGKPVRYGDHYRESIPDMWGVYYRDGRYFYVRGDKSGVLQQRLEFESEDELWSTVEKELLRSK